MLTTRRWRSLWCFRFQNCAESPTLSQLCRTNTPTSPACFPCVKGLQSKQPGTPCRKNNAPTCSCSMGMALPIPAVSGLPAIWGLPVPDRVGAWQPLVYRGKVIGAAVRTKAGVKPVYVSPGHRISLESAIRFVLATIRGYKLPEPTRLADKLAADAKRNRPS